MNDNKQNTIEMNVYLGTDDTHRAARIRIDFNPLLTTEEIASKGAAEAATYIARKLAGELNAEHEGN